MPNRNRSAALAAVVFFLLVLTGKATAARLRYHYVPSDAGKMTLQPLGNGAPGERLTWLRGWEPYDQAPRPNQWVCFQHTVTRQRVNVPLALALDSTPRLEHRPNRVIYNYGSDTVEVHFLPDGSVDVIYLSGLLRAP
jgi:hypothetical protein